MSGLAAQVVAAGREAGLAAVGVAAVEPFLDTRRHLSERRDAGLDGGMQFTYRNPERSTDPARILDGARSLVVGAWSYRQGEPTRPPGPGPLATVARYAADDHYADLRDALAAIAGVLGAAGYRTRVIADDNALVDREAAHRAGIGWYGKNSNILLPGHGSWFVLGSVVTDAELPPGRPVADGCGPCTRCIAGCPTGAIVAPGVVDARRCLAWLVQAAGVFPVEHRLSLGDRIYGCDDCQEVCPPNRRSDDGDEGDEIAAPDRLVGVLELLAASDGELLDTFGRWYIPKREPRYLRRNALVVLANSGAGDDPAVAEAVLAALADDDPIVRGHAVWAARRLGLGTLLAPLADETDPIVRLELDRPEAASAR